MADFESDGLRLHFELAGPDDGTPTVLLHGFASNYQLNWVGSRWRDALAGAGRLVVGLDQRGHGYSDKPHDPAAYAHSDMAGDVVRLLDHLGISEADVVGYSMGARIALGAALVDGSRFGGVVLGGLGTLGGFTRAEAIARRLRGDESVHDRVAENFYAFASSQPINDLDALAACILGRPTEFTADALRTLRNRFLVVVGQYDDLVSGGRELAAQIPRAEYLELPGRDHLNAVTSKEFKDAALSFLEKA